MNKIPIALFIALGIILIFVATFRGPGVDCDYEAYVKYYNEVDVDATLEPTFFIISLIVRRFCFDNVVFLFFIYAVLGIYLKFRGIKELTDLGILSIMVYLSCYYVLHDLTQIRAGVASGLLLLCIKPLYERKLGKFLLLSIIAVLFHYSAIVVLFLWFIKPKTLNRKFYLLLIPMGYCCCFCGIHMSNVLTMIPISAVQQKVNAYLYLSEYSDSLPVNIFSVLFLLRCIIAYFLLWKVDLIHISNKYVYVLLKIYLWGLVSYLFFSDVPGFSTRISELLGVVEFVLYPFMTYVLMPRKVGFLFPILLGIIILSVNLFYLHLIN